MNSAAVSSAAGTHSTSVLRRTTHTPLKTTKEKHEKEKSSHTLNIDVSIGRSNRYVHEIDTNKSDPKKERTHTLSDPNSPKYTNDIHGYDAGDETTRVVVVRTTVSPGEPGKAHRTGGDEPAATAI